MIVGEFDVPNVGECKLEKVALTPNPHGSLMFELSATGKDVGFFSLGEVYDEAGQPTADRELVHFDVHEHFRGRKVGSFLAGQAMRIARSLKAPHLVTYAANERTVSAMASNADLSRTTFQITDITGGITADTPKINKDEAIGFLQQVRLKHFPQDPNSSHILENGAAVYIRTPL